MGRDKEENVGGRVSLTRDLRMKVVTILLLENGVGLRNLG